MALTADSMMHPVNGTSCAHERNFGQVTKRAGQGGGVMQVGSAPLLSIMALAGDP